MEAHKYTSAPVNKLCYKDQYTHMTGHQVMHLIWEGSQANFLRCDHHPLHPHETLMWPIGYCIFFLYPESFWIVFLIKITHQKPSISNGIVTTPWLHTLNSFCCLVLFSASKQHIVRTCFFYILAKGLNSSGGAWQVWNFMTWSSPLPCGILLVKRWRHKPKKKQTTSC